MEFFIAGLLARFLQLGIYDRRNLPLATKRFVPLADWRKTVISPKWLRCSILGSALVLVLPSAAVAETFTAVCSGRIQDIFGVTSLFDSTVAVGTEYTATFN